MTYLVLILMSLLNFELHFIYLFYFYFFTEVQEMEENMPRTCKVQFDDPSVLHHFCLFITPDEGFWQGGRFKFEIDVPDDYNIVVSSTPPPPPQLDHPFYFSR